MWEACLSHKGPRAEGLAAPPTPSDSALEALPFRQVPEGLVLMHLPVGPYTEALCFLCK